MTVYAFTDEAQVERLRATIAPPPGGGLPPWFQSGAGSPVGVVVPAQKGALYQDTTNGALYAAVGATNADWVDIGGAADPKVAGVFVIPGQMQVQGKGDNAFVALTDALAQAGTSNGIYWVTTGVDGAQSAVVSVGALGAPKVHTWHASGDYTAPGRIDAASLGPTIPYVTMQAIPPAGPYQTPLVHDSTAVTGGLYAWDGAAYQRLTTGP